MLFPIVSASLGHMMGEGFSSVPRWLIFEGWQATSSIFIMIYSSQPGFSVMEIHLNQDPPFAGPVGGQAGRLRARRHQHRLEEWKKLSLIERNANEEDLETCLKGHLHVGGLFPQHRFWLVDKICPYEPFTSVSAVGFIILKCAGLNFFVPNNTARMIKIKR